MTSTNNSTAAAKMHTEKDSRRCMFPDCKKPHGHHNTQDHLCGTCRAPGHSRNSHGKYEEIVDVLILDGRGINCCRVCKSDKHLTCTHPCNRCGALGHSAEYCSSTDRRNDPINRLILESSGDWLPKDKWCNVADCTSRHTHVSDDHPCTDCGFRHAGEDSMVHVRVSCPMCRADCMVQNNMLSGLDLVSMCCVCDTEVSRTCVLRCQHTICPSCLHGWLSELSSRQARARFDKAASAGTRSETVDVRERVQRILDTAPHIKRTYTIIQHVINGSDMTVRGNRLSPGGAINVVAYQTMTGLELTAVHNRMIRDGHTYISAK